MDALECLLGMLGIAVPERPRFHLDALDAVKRLLWHRTRMWGALEPPGIPQESLGLYGPVGLEWDNNPVRFSTPLLMATSQMRGKSEYYVLIDIRPSKTMDWTVHRSAAGEAGCHAVRGTLGAMVRRRPGLLASLLVWVQRPDETHAWYPFVTVNPNNLLSHTIKSEPLQYGATMAVMEQRLGSLYGKLPPAIAEHPAKRPVQPNRYISCNDLIRLAERRRLVKQDAEAARMQIESRNASDDDDDDVPGFETEILCQLPIGWDDVAVTDEDRYVRDRRAYNMDQLPINWTTVAVRRFFYYYRSYVIQKDFRLPVLQKICASKLARGGIEAVSCLFENSGVMVWVARPMLVSILAMLEGIRPKLKAFKLTAEQRRCYEDAVAISRQYQAEITRFENCENRPPSPHAMTPEEEYRLTGIRNDPEEREIDAVRRKLAEANEILKERAESEVCGPNAQNETTEALDAARNARWQHLKATQPDYLELKRRLRNLEAAARRSAK